MLATCRWVFLVSASAECSQIIRTSLPCFRFYEMEGMRHPLSLSFLFFIFFSSFFFFFFLSLPGFSIQLHVLLPSGRCMVNNGLCTPRPWILAVSQSELIQRASTHWVTAVSQSSPFLHVILRSIEEVLLGAKKHFQGDFHVYEDGLSVSTHSSLLPG